MDKTKFCLEIEALAESLLEAYLDESRDAGEADDTAALDFGGWNGEATLNKTVLCVPFVAIDDIDEQVDICLMLDIASGSAWLSASNTRVGPISLPQFFIPQSPRSRDVAQDCHHPL